jgi:hypothetical protein
MPTAKRNCCPFGRHGCGTGVLVGVAVAAAGVLVAVATGVLVDVGVLVAVLVGVLIAVGVLVGGTGVSVGVGVLVGGTGVLVGVGVSVDGSGVLVGVGVGVGEQVPLPKGETASTNSPAACAHCSGRSSVSEPNPVTTADSSLAPFGLMVTRSPMLKPCVLAT